MNEWTVRHNDNGSAILMRGESHPQSHLQIFPSEDADLMALAPKMFKVCETLIKTDDFQKAINLAREVLAAINCNQQS